MSVLIGRFVMETSFNNPLSTPILPDLFESGCSEEPISDWYCAFSHVLPYDA